jgi:hypothetical protein
VVPRVAVRAAVRTRGTAEAAGKRATRVVALRRVVLVVRAGLAAPVLGKAALRAREEWRQAVLAEPQAKRVARERQALFNAPRGR